MYFLSANKVWQKKKKKKDKILSNRKSHNCHCLHVEMSRRSFRDISFIKVWKYFWGCRKILSHNTTRGHWVKLEARKNSVFIYQPHFLNIPHCYVSSVISQQKVPGFDSVAWFQIFTRGGQAMSLIVLLYFVLCCTYNHGSHSISQDGHLGWYFILNSVHYYLSIFIFTLNTYFITHWNPLKSWLS